MSRRFALLAAINDYGEASGLETLRFAEADAGLMAETLRTECGFETQLLLGPEATLDGITRALRPHFAAGLDLFLFYFAGHGELIREVGMHCLHCYGSQAGDTVNTLNLLEWAGRICRNVPAPASLMIVDACRNKVRRGPANVRGAAPGLDPTVCAELKQLVEDSRDIVPMQTATAVEQPNLLHTFLSCGRGEVSYEDARLGHGVFTHAFVEEIRARGATLPLGRLHKRVGQRTYDWCREYFGASQVPEWYEPSLGDEIFITLPASRVPAPEPSAEQDRALKLLGQAEYLEREGKLLDARSLLINAKPLVKEASRAGAQFDAALSRVRTRIQEEMALEPRQGERLRNLPQWIDRVLAHPEDAPTMLADSKLPAWLTEVLERPDAAQALAHGRAQPGGLWDRMGLFLRESAVLTPEQAKRIEELQRELEAWLANGEAWLAKGKYAAASEMFALAAERDPENPRIAEGVRAVEALRTEGQQWEQAEKSNTFEAYRAYLAAYPEGSYAGPARARLAALDLIVSPQGDGFYRTISEAILAVNENQKILVRPGIYKEGLVLDRPVSIAGDGRTEEIVVQSENAPCIAMRTGTASVSGLTLRCVDTQGRFAAVDAPQGVLALTGCDISSLSGSEGCVVIYGNNTAPELRNCRVHDAYTTGVLIRDNSRGVIDGCEIFGNSLSGMEIKTGGNPVIRNSKIRNGKSVGILVHERGEGSIDGCEITGNAMLGVEVRSEGAPVIRNCAVSKNTTGGIRIWQKGRGTIENCTFAHQSVPLNIEEGCDVKLVGVPEALITRSKMKPPVQRENPWQIVGGLLLALAGLAALGFGFVYIGLPVYGWYSNLVAEWTKGHDTVRMFLTSGTGMILVGVTIRGIFKMLSGK